MSMIWDYPTEPEYNDPPPPRDEDEIYQEWKDRKWERSQEYQQPA